MAAEAFMPHDKTPRAVETTATAAAPTAPPPAFTSVAITAHEPVVTAIEGAPRKRPRWWAALRDRGTVASASVRILVFLALLAVTSAGYAISIQRLNAMAATAAKSAPPPAATTAASHGKNGTESGSSNGGDSSSNDATDETALAPLFIHILFAAALFIELIGLVKGIRALGRAKAYPPSPTTPDGLPLQWSVEAQAHASAEAAAATAAAASSIDGTASTPTRLVRALFGPPPPKPTPPTLPTYTAALQQAARQAARREATAAAVPGFTAGRRGREQIGTGDAEDLELERVKRMGGAPPHYRSDEMRAGEVLARGPAGARRRWRASRLSSVGSDDGNAAAGPVSAVVTMFGDFVRRFSLRLSTVSADGSPTGAAGPMSLPNSASSVDGRNGEKPSPLPLPMPMSAAATSPTAIASPRRTRFATPPGSAGGHLRQRSSTSGSAPFIAASSPHVPLSPTFASTVVLELDEDLANASAGIVPPPRRSGSARRTESISAIV